MGNLTAIRGSFLDLYQETLAIVGESRRGKSVLTKAWNGMLDPNGWVESGSIMFEGKDLAKVHYRRGGMANRPRKENSHGLSGSYDRT